MTEKSPVQSIDRALELLELLCRSRNGMTIAMLVQATGLHKSTVHRLLSALAARGYVQQDAASSAYHAGMQICELSGHIVENLDVVARARAPMERLAHETSETVHLVMREGLEIVYIHKVESVHSAIRMFSRIGMRRPLYCTGVGKAILATLSDEEIETIWDASEIRAFTEHTIVLPEAFHREIARIRIQGFALDNEENELGVRCIAVAVPDYMGRAAYAMSISAPLTRMSNERVRELQDLLLAAKDCLSAVLGGKQQ